MPPAEYEYYLFDLDGTLVDVEWDYIRSVFDDMEVAMGRSFSDEEAEIIWHGLCESRNAALGRMGVDVDQFWAVYHDIEDSQARAEATYLHDDAQAIAELDSPTGVLTHCQSYLTEPVLDHLDIGDWFDTVVCCTEDLGFKPDPTPLEYTLSQLDVSAGPGIYVGDSPCDVGAAWNAGLDAAHVERHGAVKRGHTVLADYRVNSLGELLRVSKPAAGD